ncbi:hypothetical protein MJ574_16775 [Escherichia coli]|nr:hypothetical protein MJ574_16775 [Escherichia coli]
MDVVALAQYGINYAVASLGYVNHRRSHTTVVPRDQQCHLLL